MSEEDNDRITSTFPQEQQRAWGGVPERYNEKDGESRNGRRGLQATERTFFIFISKALFFKR